jgi:hypothetical protein
MAGPSLQLLFTEYKDTRAEITEISKLPERWGAIMLPLSAGILALAVNSIKDMPTVAVAFMAFLSASTIIVWRLIGYNALYRIRVLMDHLSRIERQIPREEAKVMLDDGWQRWVRAPKTFLPFLSQKALLDIIALLYILAAISLVILKAIWF